MRLCVPSRICTAPITTHFAYSMRVEGITGDDNIGINSLKSTFHYLWVLFETKSHGSQPGLGFIKEHTWCEWSLSSPAPSSACLVLGVQISLECTSVGKSASFTDTHRFYFKHPNQCSLCFLSVEGKELPLALALKWRPGVSLSYENPRQMSFSVCRLINSLPTPCRSSALFLSLRRHSVKVNLDSPCSGGKGRIGEPNGILYFLSGNTMCQ